MTLQNDCPQLGALKDFLQIVFEKTASSKECPAQIFVETHRQKGGTLSLFEMGMMATNTCPDTIKPHGLLSQWRGAIVIPGRELPFQRLMSVVQNDTGWSPAKEWEPIIVAQQASAEI